MHPARRRLLKWTRSLHIYLSLFALLSLLFFAVTGLMLNHPDWFGLDQPTETSSEAVIPASLVAEPLDKLALVEHLRAVHHAAGSVETFEADEERIVVAFKAPGRSMMVTVRREANEVEVKALSSGLMGRLTDLHKGHYSGAVWIALIDVVAVALAVLALSGFVLWTSLRTRVVFGFLAWIGGAVVLVVIYLSCTP